MRALDGLLDEGVRAGVFPLCRAEVWHRGACVYAGGNAPDEAFFDLASLTKVVATTGVFLALHRAGKVSPQARLRSFFKDAAVDCTLEDLLYHRAGLPPFRQFFEKAMNEDPALFDEDCAREVRVRVRSQVFRRALAVPPEAAVGERAVYSDIGFMLLGECLAQAGGAPLDKLFAAHVAAPLGLEAGYRRLSEQRPPPVFVAPTGRRRPRDAAPGQEGSFEVEPRLSRPAEVDDDNAWCMDGVSGHAGLFGTAHAVAKYGQAILEGKLAPPSPWAFDPRTPGSTRALGFDTPGQEAPSCGRRLGPRAIGHLGFTGTSLWVDLDRALVVALLTNRVAGPRGRRELRIREFRPRFHDAVLDTLERHLGEPA